MTIVLCGGGSGGHITPLLAVAAELRRRRPDTRLVYIGERGGKFAHIASESKLFDECRYISAGKLRRYHGESWLVRILDLKTMFLNIRDLFRLAAGTLQSYFLLKRLKPNAIMLKGGFVCVPVAVAAKQLKVPYITHDSDALPGLSNRIAARWARYHATALPAKYYRYPDSTIKVVGVPSDDRFRVYSEAERNILKEKYGIPVHAKVLLITGGSNGARRLNEGVVNIIPELLASDANLYILHQIGTGNDDQASRISSDPQVASRVNFFGFSSEIFHMSAIADVIVTRAGASAMADYGNQSKACIVVPNPFLAGGHQLKNAEVFQESDAAVIVSEDSISSEPDKFLSAIKTLLDDEVRRVELGNNLNKLVPETNPAVALADLLGDLAQ